MRVGAQISYALRHLFMLCPQCSGQVIWGAIANPLRIHRISKAFPIPIYTLREFIRMIKEVNLLRFREIDVWIISQNSCDPSSPAFRRTQKEQIRQLHFDEILLNYMHS